LYRLRYEPSTARNSNKFLDWLYWCKKLSIPCKNSTKYINGVGHGADIPLVWYSPKLNKTEVIVADQMVEYWQNFAKNNGNPNEETNDGNLINWPSYDGKNSTLMLQVDSNVGTNIESDRCNFWDQLHPL
jgi:carboxylesterase type B